MHSSQGTARVGATHWWTSPVVWVELFLLANIAFLAIDTYVAHSMNSFAHPAEWIPFFYSLAAPPLLVISMLLAGSIDPPGAAPIGRRQAAARGLGLLVGAAAVIVGVAGLLWHLNSQFFEQQTLENLVYTAPFAAPLAYAGLGLLILLNRMVPSDTCEWARWVILLALGGWIGNFVLSLADHAQNAFFHWMEWIPVASSALAIGALGTAMVWYRERGYLRFCTWVMGAQFAVGLIGWGLHLQSVLHSPMQNLWDRVVYSAPVFAPLLFIDLALLALIGLWALRRCS